MLHVGAGFVKPAGGVHEPRPQSINLLNPKDITNNFISDKL